MAFGIVGKFKVLFVSIYQKCCMQWKVFPVPCTLYYDGALVLTLFLILMISPIHVAMCQHIFCPQPP